MYKYTGIRTVTGRILGKNFCLGAERVNIARPLPKLPNVFPKATQEQMKALHDLGYPYITIEKKKPKNEPKSKESDTRHDTGLIEDNDLD